MIAPLLNLSIASRDVHATLDLLRRLRDVRRAAHRGQRNPRWKCSSHRCVIALRNATARCKTSRERENRGDVMATYFVARRSSMPSQPSRLAPAV